MREGVDLLGGGRALVWFTLSMEMGFGGRDGVERGEGCGVLCGVDVRVRWVVVV